ncbi:MAG: hypothetical protein L3J22_01055 [Xanthomonadales bacterium]|nr:hypothetical protein [Xanthomonadales bacterium]
MKVTQVLLVSSLIAGLFFAQDATARGAKPMIDPERVSFKCDLDSKQIRHAITVAMTVLGWTATYTDDGVKGNIVVRGKHTLNVLVKYDPESFDVNYTSSDNLKYKLKKGRPYIHANASSWMDNLKNGISAQLLSMDCN